MSNLKAQAPYIGIVLAIVFIIIGLNYSNSGVLIIGLIFLAVGSYSWYTNRGK